MSSDEPHARLYRLADGRFQIVGQGELTLLMIGFGYVLIEKEFGQYLVDLNLIGVEIVEAVIYEPWRKEEIHTHRQLLIGEHFSSDLLRYPDPTSHPDENRDIDLDGERFLLMDYQYVYVTGPLRDRLVESRFEYLRFISGLDGFAAAGAADERSSK